MKKDFMVFLLVIVGVCVGIILEKQKTLERCVNKYSNMPHSEVESYCLKLLNFSTQ